MTAAVAFKIHPEATPIGEGYGDQGHAVPLTTPTQSRRKQSKEGLSILYAFEMLENKIL